MDTEIMGLGGKTAVVTGGSRGVGRATAILLGRLGASVGIGYFNREREAAETVAHLERMGVRAWAEPGDLGRSEDAEALFARADREFGGLDIFVGNAGIWPPEDIPMAQMTDAHWHRTVAMNLDSIFFTTREAAKRMEDNGRIVLVSSTAGQRGEAFHADYAATKGAIIPGHR